MLVPLLKVRKDKVVERKNNMSKYNLTDILNEYIGGGRIGTLKISYRDLVDKMDELEKSGKVIVREIPGPSGDGKTNREFEVVDRDSAVPGGKKQERGFTVYDYKFGFDPGSIDNYEEEYDFSVGGNDLQLAMDLIDGVKAYGLRETIAEGNLDDLRKLKDDLSGALEALKKKAKELKLNVDFGDATQAVNKYIDDVFKSNMERTGGKIDENIPPSREDNVIRDLAKADEVIDIIKMMNPDVRDDLLKRIARMGQGMGESINEGDLFSSEFDRQELKAIINDLNKGLILDMPTRRAYKFLVSLLDNEDKKELGLNEEVSDENYAKGLQLVQKVLSKEGGAAGLKPIYDALKDLGFARKEVVDLLKKMTKVKKHRDGDYILLPLEEGHGLSQSDVDILKRGFNAFFISAPKYGEMDEFKKVIKFILKSNILQDKTMDLSKGKANEGHMPMADLFMAGSEEEEEENGGEEEEVTNITINVDEVMDIDRKGRKKPESKSNMTKVNEASQEESVATYIQDYYRNPKTGESMISDEMVDEFYKTHPEWEDQADGTKEGMEAVLDNFNEFFEINYGIMFDDSRGIDEIDINTVQNDPGSGDADNPEGEELEASSGYDAAMEQLREHFNRFK